jgi:hypothetical protein
LRYLNKHSAREKHLLRLEREVERLNQATREAPIIPLEHPYQRGWVKTYVLHEQVGRRPDAQIFRNILKVINRRVHCRNRNFVSRKGDPIILRPQIIYLGDWRDLAWPASHQKFFGFGTWRIEDPPFWLPPNRAWRCGYKLFHDWWLREDIQPYMITHQRVELPEVRARYAEIDAHLHHTQGWAKLARLRGGRRWWRFSSSTRNELAATEHLADALRSADDPA